MFRSEGNLTAGTDSVSGDDGGRLFGLGALGLATLYLVISFCYLSHIPLIDPDEPRYASAGRTLARNGSLAQPETLLIPTFKGQPRTNKPPLFYWLVALSDKLAGQATEGSARAPSIALGLVMLLTTVFLGRRVFGGKTGLLAGLVLLSTPLFMVLSRVCVTDMVLSAFMSGALALWMLASLGLSPPRRSTWLAGLCLGLAMLTKATPALAAVLVIIVERALSSPPGRPGRCIPWLLVVGAALSGVAIMLQNHKQLDTLFSTAALLCALAVVAILCLMAKRASWVALARMPWGWALGLADRVAVLDFGAKIAEGTGQEVTANPVVIEAYLGVEEKGALTP